ncbi:MAG: SGNH/GDSL hydrolase family protein [Chloroflexi bacterium]|nr:SGNH/GDSL hydrolase family protein [Chloroflexota bacterium]
MTLIPAGGDLPANANPTWPVENPAHVPALPSGPVTLVALGDSLTQGDGDDTGRGYVGRLVDLVNMLRPGSSAVNLGQSGWNSDALINGDQGLPGQLGRAVKELQSARQQERASIALVWIGSNDLWYLYEYGGDGSDAGDAKDVEHFAANLDVILSALRATESPVVIALLDDQSKRPVALKGRAFTSINSAELKRMSEQVLKYNNIISEKALHYGVLTVDLYHTNIFTSAATLYDDGNHPNAAGYDIIAGKWFDVLSALFH